MTATPPRGIPYDSIPLRRIAAAITNDLGIKMPDGKLTMLHGRLQRRLNELGLVSLVEYESLLRNPAHARDERTALYDLATTNKTDFFREPGHFEYLTTRALPVLRPGDRPWICRVWCAGCSTGQEVYTLAMVLDDYARSHPGFSYEIIGTDISTRVLRDARAATYPIALTEPIPTALRQRYLLRGTGERAGLVRVVPELRARVKLQRLNFMDDHYALGGEFHVVFFRNVMIYFDRATQRRVLERQSRLLVPGGYVFIGHTESVAGLTIPLVSLGNSVLRRPT